MKRSNKLQKNFKNLSSFHKMTIFIFKEGNEKG